MTETQLQKVITQLENHEKRIRVLEGGEVRNLPQKEFTQRSRKQNKSKGEDLHPPIQKLVDSGFFSENKIDLDVVSELQRKLLTSKKPLRSSVVNVLRKLVRDEVLERTEAVRGEKKLIAYIKV